MSRRDARGPSQRQLRVGEELRHALARILGRAVFSDPVLAGSNITVTEVRVSPDLRNATAFVVPLGGGSLDDTVAALNRAAGYVRALLAQEVELRFMPRIGFQADHSFDHASRLRELLDAPRVRRDLTRPPEQEGPATAERDEGGDGQKA